MGLSETKLVWRTAVLLLLLAAFATRAEAQPRLQVRELPGRQIQLSWPQEASDFVLEVTSALSPAAPWNLFTVEPVPEAKEWVVRVTPGSANSFFRLRQATPGGLTRVIATSPAAGETGVAVTRETVIRFSGPLGSDVTVGNEQFYANFGGHRILSRVHLSSDRRTLTLFYLEPLPGAARVRVTLNGVGLRDELGREVDLDGDGQPGGTLRIDFNTLSLEPVSLTAICGRVFASELARSGSGDLVNVPLSGVTITVDGKEETMRAVTDQFGDFRLEPVPAGDFFVHIDGRTAIRTAQNDFPRGAYYPFVGKKWTGIAGEEVNIGNIYLPLVVEGTLQPTSPVQATIVTFPPSVLAERPELAGVTVTIPPNGLFSDNGVPGGMVGIAPVPPDRLPEPLPLGLSLPLVITVQTDGPSNFDRPVPVCFPNLPNPVTGQILQPGDKSALWSFNHDIGAWEIGGPMTVSADGKLVCTDAGVGIRQPGWHGSWPGSTADGGDEFSGGDSESDYEPENGGPPDASDPVYLFSGEFHMSVEDLRIPGRGIDFMWIRKYRSKVGPNTAQGNGWDYSYNVAIQQSGADIFVLNGSSRVDRYQRQPDGTYSRNGHFREMVRNADGTFTLTFEDTGHWWFRAFDGTAASGKLARIVDRNGNALGLEYDALGRLVKITDTLDRDIQVSYNADGFISSITDFAGRSVQYAYYDGGEPGGNRGDLKSVTTPVVIGTPNANDFPRGKTTTYTYSTGFADERLNHNLLTITDGRRNDPQDPTFGQGPYLVNVYSPAVDPNDPNYDRVVRQIIGGDVIDYTYVRQLPSNANGNVVTKVIANDRNGNVKEYFYDKQNRMARMREYTGRANPREPATDTANRPANKLRATDPDYFETRYEWTEDSLQRRIIHPNGNIVEYVYERDLNPNASPRTRGNLRILRQLPGTHSPAGEQAVIEEHYEYDPRFGGAGYMTRVVDGRGNATTYTYDARGNRIRAQHRISSIVEQFEYNQFGQLIAYVHPDNGSGHKQRDEFIYYESGPQRGYLQSRVDDAGQLWLTSTYEYDAVGNPVRVIDPRGNDTRYVVNSLNQVVREISREVRPGSGIRYERDQHYDANNNLIRVDIQNVDEEGRVQANSHITIAYEYEILNFPVTVIEEVDATRSVAEEYVYDGNRNRVLTRYGEAINGNQPSNVRQTLYDERDLEFQVIRAPGDLSQSTTQFDYDRNGNQSAVRSGIEESPRVMTVVYDGYNRPARISDPLGNVQHTSFDENDNRVRIRFEGELVDVPGNAGNVRLSDVRYVFDAMNRVVRTESAFFDTATQMPIGDGIAVGQMFYSDRSEIVRMVDGNGNDERRAYDTANRLSQVIDAKGNSSSFEYDPNDNLKSVTELELSDLGEAPESYITRYEYDGLDRQVRLIDSAGNIHDYAYDSRDNQVLDIDAQRSSAGQPGNVTRFEYDGLSRLVRTITTLTSDGTGSGAPAGFIVLSQTWDDSNRLSTQTDPNGNTTIYTYDGLNREVGVQFADGTANGVVYDVHDNIVQRRDANGSATTTTYDLLNRAVRVDVTPGPGVSSATTFEVYRYDGLSRLVYGEDDDSVVTRSHNSFSHIIRETQNGRLVLSTYDPVGSQVAVVYPGGRVIRTGYDELNRKKVIQDEHGDIAVYDYVGPGRVKRRQYGNGTQSEFEYNGRQGAANSPNDFGVKQIVRTAHSRIAGGTVLDNRTYTWDRMHNKSSRRDHGPGGITQQFNYDSLYRLVRSTTSSGAAQLETVQYELDAAGNRKTVVGGPDAGIYTMSAAAPEPADAQVNQYTATPAGFRRHDLQGNLTRIGDGLPGQKDIAYDYRNQMVEHVDHATGARTTYRYDVFGRRIERGMRNGPGEEVTRFYYNGWQVCEEQNAAGSTLATYVYGNYLDEILSMERGGGDYFYHADDQFSVVSVTDANGDVVERYEYEDYGLAHISDPSGFPRARSAIGNPYLFTGQRLDAETGFYYFKTRYLDVRSGRFTTRDTLGIWGDPANLGNSLAYVGNNPWSLLDPLGLQQGEQSVLAAAVSGFFEGLQGGASIATNTYSFGLSDKLGLTNSGQYQGREYDAARFTATVSREAVLAALTGGASAARGGACMLQNMGRLAPLVQAIQASKHGPKIASLMHKILEAINTGRDAADFVAELRKLLRGNGSLFDAIMSGIGVLSGIDGLRSMPGFCFTEDTLVSTPDGFEPIGLIVVGSRVVTTDDPETAAETKVEPRSWRLVELTMPVDPEGNDVLEMRLLRPLEWLYYIDASIGRQFQLSIPERGIEGNATITSIRECPPIQLGRGRVVLGTYRSRSDWLLRFYFAGSEYPLITTAGHPLFSEGQRDWQRAYQFRAGDCVRTASGGLMIERIELLPGVQSVINLEVETARCFLVSLERVLSHNSQACPTYGELRKSTKGTDFQANHLNQNAAFRDVIPREQGVANAMKGNAFTQPGTPHYEFHKSIEGFWDKFRQGGSKFGETPTNRQYGNAVEKALRAAGYSKSEAKTLAREAAANRATHGLKPSDPVPRIPGRINQRRP
jgi:RHS repeat-associated protein